VVNCPHCGITSDDDATVCARCGSVLGVTAATLRGELAPGLVVHGRYAIQKQLGRGGMGVVYKAHDRGLDEIVAIKILRPEFSAEPEMAERFKSEIKLARKVRHRNVCSIHDFGEDGGLFYFTMEFIDGVDLKRLIKQSGALPTDEAYALTIQIAEGLRAVHEVGIIHRDMKTANVMRDAHGAARLMDFGVAKRPGEGQTLTAVGQIVGTPEYMSPEQAQGKKVDHRTDLYALGIVIYEIFTGNVPFKGDTPISTILKQINDPLVFDAAATKRILPGLRPVLERALAKDPADRFGSTAELVEAVRRSRSPSLRQERVPTVALEAPTVVRAKGQQPAQPSRGFLLPVGGVVAAAVVGMLAFHFLKPDETAVTSSTTTELVRGGLPVTTSSPRPPDTVPPTSVPPSTTPLSTAAPTTVPPKAAPTSVLTSSARTTSSIPITFTIPDAAKSGTAPATSSFVTSSTSIAALSTVAAAGFLQVGVVPWAEVTLDGRVLGTTPIDAFALPPGRHRVRLRHPSYEVLEREILIRSGETSRMIVSFPKEGVPKR